MVAVPQVCPCNKLEGAGLHTHPRSHADGKYCFGMFRP